MRAGLVFFCFAVGVARADFRLAPLDVGDDDILGPLVDVSKLHGHLGLTNVNHVDMVYAVAAVTGVPCTREKPVCGSLAAALALASRDTILFVYPGHYDEPCPERGRVRRIMVADARFVFCRRHGISVPIDRETLPPLDLKIGLFAR